MRLSTAHRQWIYWSAGLLFASGALWLACHYFLEGSGEFGPTTHPLEPWCLRVHGAAAMLSLVLVGSLLPIHVRRAWHQRRNLLPGAVLFTVVLLLAVSGYALYYFGGEEARAAISVFHWAIGLGAPVLMVWHIAAGRGAAARRALAERAGNGPASLAARRRDPAS